MTVLKLAEKQQSEFFGCFERHFQKCCTYGRGSSQNYQDSLQSSYTSWNRCILTTSFPSLKVQLQILAENRQSDFFWKIWFSSQYIQDGTEAHDRNNDNFCNPFFSPERSAYEPVANKVWRSSSPNWMSTYHSLLQWKCRPPNFHKTKRQPLGVMFRSQLYFEIGWQLLADQYSGLKSKIWDKDMDFCICNFTVLWKYIFIFSAGTQQHTSPWWLNILWH